MLEAARRMDETMHRSDEASEGEVGFLDEEAPAAGQAQRLVERQVALEELRDVFLRVAQSAPVAGRSGPGGPLACLKSLAEAEDRLIFQAGQRPGLRHRGVWSDAHADVVSRRPTRRSRPPHAAVRGPGPGGRPRGTAHPSRGGRHTRPRGRGRRRRGGAVARPIELPPPDEATLHGDHDGLAQVLAHTPAVVLVGGPDLTSARALLHALLATLVENQQATLLVVTSDSTYRLPGAAGVALRVPPASCGRRCARSSPGWWCWTPRWRAATSRSKS